MFDLQMVAAACTVVLFSAFMVLYLWQVATRRVSATLSSWLIFFVGTSLSFATYLGSGGVWHHSLLNVLDPAIVLIVVIAIVIRNPHGISDMHLLPFERKYLVGAVGIAVFWGITKDAFLANLLVQVILGIGYLPMVERLIRTRQATESLVSWGLAVLANACGCWVAWMSGSTLAIVYGVRSTIMPLALFLFMVWILATSQGRHKASHL